MSSKIGIVDSIEVDSFWSSKHKATIWRVTVYFKDGSTPFRNFQRTEQAAYAVANHYWRKVEEYIRGENEHKESGS